MRRYWTNYNTSAANATEQLFTITTNDDYRTRHLKSIFCSLLTAGIQLSLYVAGQEYATIDCSRFAAGDQVVELDVDVPARLQAVIGLKDLAGSAHSNFAVVLGYEVDAGTGP